MKYVKDVTVPEFFTDKEIFITGGSGFIGKVLIEKLLRCCPDIKMIYILVRSKKGQNVQERTKSILDNELFDKVKKENPKAINKVVAVSGDVMELGLGLNEEDKAKLMSCNIVFHVAASVRFDDPLNKAILMNTRGTREVLELMLLMPNLEVGVHVSTAYCNTDKDVIEEKVYRDHGDWKEAIRIAENYKDDYATACLTEKCLGGLKNTYLYTKHLAENVVEDYAHRLPLVIYRPGVVVCMWKDPLPGWMDNLNGPTALYLAVGKGFLRAIHVDPDQIVDNMPVDMVINGLITATWKKGTGRDTEILPVYNCTMDGYLKHTQAEVREVALKLVKDYPYNGAMWYPDICFIKSYTLFRIQFLLLNVLVAIMLDGLLKVAGRKPFLSKLTRKTYYGITSVSYFILRNWEFKSRNFTNLNKELKRSDWKDFLADANGFVYYDIIRDARFGTSKYILKEDVDIPSAKVHMKRLKFLHYTIKYLFWTAILYYLILPLF